MKTYDVLVIGGGPGGLAAAIAATKGGARVLLLEREAALGGILKQCIHDGFGLLRFGEKLSGPEYAGRFEDEFHSLAIACEVQTFVTAIRKKKDGFLVRAVNRAGVQEYRARALVLATGCRERTAKQVLIHGTRPAGIFTAGCAQHFVNLMGQMPAKRCVILGSGDIGLIMARRLTLEGAKVLGVYEVKPTPSGLTRNLVQCLEDYGIPLYLSHTVTRVFGTERLTGVEIAQVDERMRPIAGTEERVDCDTLILSVGLIPENEIAESLGVPLDPGTKGPVCDNRFMTMVDGVFCCGNALHVNDLVDYVSESGEIAGGAAAAYAGCETGSPGKTDAGAAACVGCEAGSPGETDAGAAAAAYAGCEAGGSGKTDAGAAAYAGCGSGGSGERTAGAVAAYAGCEADSSSEKDAAADHAACTGNVSGAANGEEATDREERQGGREPGGHMNRAGRTGRAQVEIKTDASLLYLVPQRIDLGSDCGRTVLYFRSRETMREGTFQITVDGLPVFTKRYRNLKPPEMERLELDITGLGITERSAVEVSIAKGGAL